MENRQKNPIFSLTIGYAATFLVGLGALKFVVIDDTQGYLLTIAGFTLMSIFLGIMEKELDLKNKKALWTSKTVLGVVFLVLTFWIYGKEIF